MITRERFFQEYDYYMPRYCEPYHHFLSLAATVIPPDLESICDIGIGTGNFSAEVKKRIPGVKVYGIDTDREALRTCQQKIPDATLYPRDIFSGPLPKSDYILSSLALHHLDTATRKEKLLSLIRNVRGLVNFDIMLFDGNTFDDSIGIILDFAARHFHDKDDLQTIEHEMRMHDNPMPLDEQQELFMSAGYDFHIVAQKAPYAVYHVSNPARNR